MQQLEPKCPKEIPSSCTVLDPRKVKQNYPMAGESTHHHLTNSAAQTQLQAQPEGTAEPRHGPFTGPCRAQVRHSSCSCHFEEAAFLSVQFLVIGALLLRQLNAFDCLKGSIDVAAVKSKYNES